METLEFLGGKYQKTEQIVPGPVQTFRAREAASGREVFVHRVSSTEEQAEQTALLRMLTTVLLRSAEARKLVLDFGDDQGFWYVVTESEPRCLILREWLQFELHRAAGSPAAEKHEPEKPPVEPPPMQPPARQAQPQALPIQPQALKVQQEATQPGEFTRMFEASPRISSPAPAAAPPIQAEKISVVFPMTAPPPAPSEPGEFTRVFQTFAPAQPLGPPIQPDTAPMPPPTSAAQTEPGEFTRFFQEGLPRPAGKTVSSPEVKRSPEKLSRGGFVQRPHTPMPPVPQKSSEPGEFTRMFSHPNADAPKSRDLFADYPDPKPESAKLFSGAEMPKAKLPEHQEPGEYTRIFGGSTTPLPEPPPPQQPFTVSDRAPASADDPLRGTKPLTVPPVMPAAAPKGPSEYTMVIQGNRPVEAAGSPASAAGGNAASPLALPKVPAVPQLKVPSVSVPKPPAMPAPAQINAVAAASNKKLIIFFGILTVLAVVLILLIVLIAVKK